MCSIRNPPPLPARSWGRAQLPNGLSPRNMRLPGCWHWEPAVLLQLIRFGLATSGVTDASGGQELEPAKGIQSSVRILQDR